MSNDYPFPYKDIKIAHHKSPIRDEVFFEVIWSIDSFALESREIFPVWLMLFDVAQILKRKEKPEDKDDCYGSILGTIRKIESTRDWALSIIDELKEELNKQKTEKTP